MAYADMQRKKTYQSYQDMKQRCYNEKCHNYKNYGARGIRVSERWFKFSIFLSDMGLKPDGLTLERKDNNGHYTPENCRWASRKDQRRNQRDSYKLSLNGETKSIPEWSEKLGINQTTIRSRIRRGFPIEKMLSKSMFYGNAAIRQEKRGKNERD